MEEDEKEQEKRQQLEALELKEAAILALGRAFQSDSTAQGDKINLIETISNV